MSAPRDAMTRTLMLVFAGVGSVAMLIASVALLIWAKNSGTKPEPAAAPGGSGNVVVAREREAAVQPAAGGVVQPAAGGRRFTLRLGQGFRFKDGVVVIAKPDENPDVEFRYLPPQVGGMSTRYNPISQQVETGLEPTLTSPVPIVAATHVKAFADRPDVARTTTGDVAGYDSRTPVGTKTRHLLVMNRAGDAFLLTLDELEAPLGKYDDWRIGFAFEPVQLPVGVAGGRPGKPLPGKLVYRDWYRTKMIVGVDLTSGKEESLADGILPSIAGDRALGFGDPSGAYVVRDGAGKTLHTIRFNEEVLEPVLSPDGTRLLATVRRPGEMIKAGDVTFPGAAVPSVAVFDLSGREVAVVPGYDEAAWTPDGKIVATAKYDDPGLFEIDPGTKAVRAIGSGIGAAGHPAVAADGKAIAFVNGGKVWLINRDGSDLRQLFQDGHTQQRPTFSPDGTKVAVIVCNLFAIDGTGEVVVIDVRTGEVTALRTGTGVSLVPDTTTRLNWVP